MNQDSIDRTLVYIVFLYIVLLYIISLRPQDKQKQCWTSYHLFHLLLKFCQNMLLKLGALHKSGYPKSECPKSGSYKLFFILTVCGNIPIYPRKATKTAKDRISANVAIAMPRHPVNQGFFEAFKTWAYIVRWCPLKCKKTFLRNRSKCAKWILPVLL